MESVLWCLVSPRAFWMVVGLFMLRERTAFSCRVASHMMATRCVSSRHVTSRHITSHHITQHYVASGQILPHHVTSCHVTSCRTASVEISSHLVASCPHRHFSGAVSAELHLFSRHDDEGGLPVPERAQGVGTSSAAAQPVGHALSRRHPGGRELWSG